MKKTISSFILTSLLFGVGCSYHFGFHQQKLPGGYDQVAIPIFKNKTTEVGIETYFTNEIIRQLARSGVAKVISKDKASVTLEGVIEDLKINRVATVTQSAIRHLPSGVILTTSYRIQVGVRFFLRRNSDNRVLWENVFRNEQSYFAPQLGSAGVNSANALYNQNARHQTLAKMAADMMVHVHDQLVESF